MNKLIINTLSVVTLLVCSVKAEQTDKPNIILMMADDLGWGDLKCYNEESDILTPELEKMVEAGMKFNRFYAASNADALTRGSVLTGRSPMRYGLYEENQGYLKNEEVTLAEVLQEEGYATGHFGKWHLGTMTTEIKDGVRGGPGNNKYYSPPWQHGFDTVFSTESEVPTWDPMLKPVKDAANHGWTPIDKDEATLPYNTHYWNESGSIVEDNVSGDDSKIIVDRVVDFIDQASKKKKPFFAAVWFHAPSLPAVGGLEYLELYPNEGGHRKNYYASVTAMDKQIGRIRDKVKSLSIAENTIICFCSDNGPVGGNSHPGKTGGLQGRGNGTKYMKEGGIRVPSIIEWPAKVKAGSVTDFVAVTSDYFPTLLGILGKENTYIKPLDGISLLPAIIDPEIKRDGGIGFHYAWVEQQYKILDSFKGRWLLYDLQEDPKESNDIADSHPQIVDEMEKRFEEWKSSCEKSNRGADY